MATPEPACWLLVSHLIFFPPSLPKQATNPGEKPEEEEKDQMARGPSHRLPQTPVCHFATGAPRSALDVSLLPPTHGEVQREAPLGSQRQLWLGGGSLRGPDPGVIGRRGLRLGRRRSCANRRRKGAAGPRRSNIPSSFQRPPWCLFKKEKKRKKSVGFICKHFSL